MSSQTTIGNNPDSSWNLFYKLGGVSALIAALVFRRWLNAELVLFKNFGLINIEAPNTQSALDWFNFIQKNRLIGLISLGFFDIINYMLVGLILLGLYFSLHDTHKSVALLALIIGFTGICVYLPSNQALAILSLSDQYATASEAIKPNLLATGQSLLELNSFSSGGSGILIGFYFVNLSSLLMALIMVNDKYFTKIDAYIGIIANGANECSFLFLLVAPSFIVIAIVPGSIFLFIWYLLIGLKLLKFKLLTTTTPLSN